MNQNIFDTLKDTTAEVKLALTTRTLTKLLKKDKEGNKNELGDIYKVAEVVVVINKRYQTAVNEQRTNEGKPADFVTSERKWGVSVGPFVTKGDNTYLNAILLDQLSSKYIDSNNNEVAISVVAPFMGSRTSGSGSQQLDEAVKVRAYNIDNIVAFKLF